MLIKRRPQCSSVDHSVDRILPRIGFSLSDRFSCLTLFRTRFGIHEMSTFEIVT